MADIEGVGNQLGGSPGTIVELNADGPTVVPGGDALLISDFARSGDDLRIDQPDGETLTIQDYFGGDGAPAALQTEGGAVLNGATVARMAKMSALEGDDAPQLDTGADFTATFTQSIGEQMAQASGGEPAGSIDSLKGSVAAVRDGVEVQLGAGDPIFEGDVLVTGAGSAVGIVFADDSTMSMGGDARIAIDEMVYNADAGSGSQLFDIVQGAFVFASGQIGKNNPEDVQVRTPVATIGIRGTKYAVNVDQDLGDATVTLFEGAVVVENGAGQVLLNSIGQSTVVTSSFNSPRDPFVMDPETQTETYGDAIDYHPEEGSGRNRNEDNDSGGGDQGVDEADLGADELEALAEELDDLDTAAGPSGVLAGVSESGLLIALLSQALEGNDFFSGQLDNDQFGSGSAFASDGQNNNPLDPVENPIFGGNETVFENFSFNPGGGTVSFSFSSGTVYSATVSGGESANDIFAINAAETSASTNWVIGGNSGATDSDGTQNVSITEGGGSDIDMNNVEELVLNTGSSGDTVTINDLSSTDIAESTVFVNTGEGNDIIDASAAGRRLVLDGQEGNDAIAAGDRNDDLRGGDGNDILDGGTGNDFLDGGIGDDIISVTLEGGSVTSSEDPVELSDEYEFGDSAVASARQVDIISGGEGNDIAIVRFDAAQADSQAFVDDLIALKTHIASGDTDSLETFNELGLQIVGVENVVFDGPFPDPNLSAEVSVSDAIEGALVPVTITLGEDADSPLLETSITLTGVPSDAQLLSGETALQPDANGAYTLTVEQVADLAIQLDADSDADFELSVTVTAENVLTGATGTGEAGAAVDVAAVADAPTLDVSAGQEIEGDIIPITLNAGLSDTDGSETLTVEVSGLEDGVSLMDANGNTYTGSPVTVPAGALSLVPVAGFVGAVTLTVVATSTEADGGDTAETTQTLIVDVDAGVLSPVLGVSDATGNEDSAIALDVSATPAQEGDTIALVISGLPEGAVLTNDNEETFEGDSISLTPDQLAGLTVVPAADSDADFTLTVTATATRGEDSTVSETSLTVTVDPVADTPTLTVQSASGAEDGALALSIDAALTDVDGSEVLTVEITGLPQGFVLTDSQDNEYTGDPIEVPGDLVGGLTLTPLADFAGTVPLTVRAISTDGTDTAVSEKTLNVTIDAVADTPSLTVAVGDEQAGDVIPVTLTAGLSDTDGSETLTVEVTGLPEGFSLTDGEQTYSGDPVAVPAGALSLIPVAGFVGAITLAVTATATEGSNQDTDSTTQTVTIDVDAGAVSPALSVLNASGDEDGAIALTVDAAPGQDGDTVLVTISGLPDGVVLSNAEGEISVSGSSVTLLPEQLDGLTIQPPADSDADFTLSITATATRGDDVETLSANLTVDIDAVADTPSLTVTDALGIEDIGIDLDIDGALADIDGSESLTIEIGGLPAGFTITDENGVELSGDPITISGDEVDGLTLHTTANFTGTVPLTVRAIATETDGGSTAVAQKTLSVTIDPAIDIPVITVGEAAGDENTDIALNIDIGGLDVNETLTLSMEGLPEGATLTNAAGDEFSGDPVALTMDQLVGLSVTPPAHSSTDFDLTLVATSSQGEISDSVSQTIPVTVSAKADTPFLSVGDIEVVLGRAGADEETGTSGDDILIGGAGEDTLSGGEGNDTLTGDGDNLSATASLDITAAVSDPSELLSVTLSDVPEGVEIYQDGFLLATGSSVTLAADSLDGITLVIPPGTADFNLTVTARSLDFDTDGGGDSATTSTSIAVTVDDGSALGTADVLDGGAGDDILDGGEGADTLISGTGSDTLLGGGGADTLNVTREAEGFDVVDGGSGSDTLTLTMADWDLQDAAILDDLRELVEFVASGDAAVGSKSFSALGIQVDNIEALSVLDAEGAPIDVYSVVIPEQENLTEPEPIIEIIEETGVILSGDNDDNTLVGTDYDDTISGGHGDDVLEGGAGNDTLDGGTGEDTLRGGAGDDTLRGGHEADVLEGGADNDILDGGTADDVLDGGSGDDVLDGGHNDDTLTGGAGDDTLTGGTGEDVIHADSGNDIVDAGTDNDTVIVTIDPEDTDRDVTIDGGSGDDVLRVSLSSEQPDLEGVLSEIAAATSAAHDDPSATHVIESLGITFNNIEDIEIYVDDALYSFDPTVSEPEDIAMDATELVEGATLFPNIDIGDLDGDTMTSATVELGEGYQAGDILSVDSSTLDAAGLSVTAVATDDGYTLTISGDGSIEDYESVLSSVKLASENIVPEGGARAVSVSVTDDDGNSSTPVDVTIDVSVPELPDLVDTSEEDRDSTVFISEASASGVTVTDVSDIPSTETNTLTLEVAKLGWGGTGQFEVLIDGEVVGTLTTTSKLSGNGSGWQTLEVDVVTVDRGEDISVELRATASNSNVIIKGVEWGDTVLHAASDGFGIGEWSDDDDYVMLSPLGSTLGFTVAADPNYDATNDWAVVDDGATAALSEDDLGERYGSLDQGDGEDWVVAEAGATDDLDIDLTGDIFAGTDNVVGGQGDDTLTGDDGDNILAGGDGNDILIGGGGEDAILGGSGDDLADFDIEDFDDAAGENVDHGTLDDAIRDAYAANDVDGAAALESIRAGFDGGSGTDTLRLSGGDAEGNSLSSDALAAGASSVEVLDVTQVEGPVDMTLAVEDLVSMNEDGDELKILKDGDDTVEIDGQSYEAGEHQFSVNGVDFKVVIENSDQPADV